MQRYIFVHSLCHHKKVRFLKVHIKLSAQRVEL
jgi:hypothetical protein